METNISDVLKILNDYITLNKSKPLTIPAPLILGGAINKNGLSARDIAKEIIVRQSEAGAPIGPLADGSDNVAEKMELIRMEVLIEHIIRNAKITVVLPPGIPIFGVGLDAMGTPVTVQGVTTGLATGTAIIQ
jgi:hypothetical protein